MVEIAGTKWRVEDVAGHRALDDVQPDIAFGEDGVATGTTGVNRFRATWTLDGDRLSFGPGMTTMMAGPPAAMDQEQRWLSVLGQPLTVGIDEQDLVLEGDKGSSRLVRIAQLVVRGSLLYRERILMPERAVVTVVLQDTARADAPAPALAEQRIEQPPNVPVPFQLAVDRAAVEAHARLSVSARITEGDELLWVTDTHNAVDPDLEEPLEIVLVRAR